MPVNVAFGPAAGLGGQLAFGTGSRQYSDKRDAIEQQSKRQMLSDAMGFAKYLQDARRPEEDQRRSLERMEKQQEISQENAYHSEGLRRSGAEWNQNQTIRVRKEQIESLQGAREKIDREFQEKKAAGMPNADLQKWAAKAYGMADAQIMGSKPPAAQNPFDSVITMNGEQWAIKDGSWENLSVAKEGRQIEQDKLQILRQQNQWREIEAVNVRGDKSRKAATDPLHNELEKHHERYSEAMITEPTTENVSEIDPKTGKPTGKKIKKNIPGWGMKHPLYAAWKERTIELNSQIRAANEKVDLQTESSIEAILRANIGGAGSDDPSRPSSSARQLAEIERGREERRQAGVAKEQLATDVKDISEGVFSTEVDPLIPPTMPERVKDTSSPWIPGSRITTTVADAIGRDSTGRVGKRLVDAGMTTPKEIEAIQEEKKSGTPVTKKHDVGLSQPLTLKGKPRQQVYAGGVAADIKGYRALASRYRKDLRDKKMPPEEKKMARMLVNEAPNKPLRINTEYVRSRPVDGGD